MNMRPTDTMMRLKPRLILMFPTQAVPENIYRHICPDWTWVGVQTIRPKHWPFPSARIAKKGNRFHRTELYQNGY